MEIKNKNRALAVSGQNGDVARASNVAVAMLALGLGLALLSVAGFASSAHDVAHDSRHAFSFPCH